ncbi:Chitin biosynthesis protein CHS5 [Frankliniella fusca]|uniref:Chitin biosynthesis protein CHS5 n=1 Tax=Frankliniella fusca TaxID=407009 RepID=A0AAE1HYI6_9NEOP|nr:Chitin biosynthesis protein CHS5 [Frankliniella fusca]
MPRLYRRGRPVRSRCASLAVKNISMSLPDAVAQGSTVTLRCDYDLEGQQLYSIKWFRGESEFYQYVPKEIPASKVFDVDGVKIKVDVSV